MITVRMPPPARLALSTMPTSPKFHAGIAILFEESITRLVVFNEHGGRVANGMLI